MRLPRRAASTAAVVAATTLLLTGCAGAPAAEDSATASTAGYPVEISSCGHTSTITAPPERAVTLNQGATEVALALGVADRLAGTAYLDDQVPEKWRAAYESVPVLSETYPTKEEFLAAEPDFAYASYPSAFEAKAVGTQKELAAGGISSYLSPFACAEGEAPAFAAIWDEVTSVAKAFGVPDRAEEIIAQQQAELQRLGEQAAGDGIEVFWYDSGLKVPYTGVGGGPQLVMDAVGATNPFSGLGQEGWAEVSWEKILQADPDVIVLADASWSTAAEKRKHLESDPVLGQLQAVQQNAYVTIAFSESTPGVRLVEGAASLARQLTGLAAR